MTSFSVADEGLVLNSQVEYLLERLADNPTLANWTAPCIGSTPGTAPAAPTARTAPTCRSMTTPTTATATASSTPTSPGANPSSDGGPAASERRDAADSSHPDPYLLLFCTNIAN